jgi:hypothetical protein
MIARQKVFMFAAVLSMLAACGKSSVPIADRGKLEFTRLPPAGTGSPDQLYAIEGTVSGAGPKQRVVLYALAGNWWVQPFMDRPFTEIDTGGQWKSLTHPGMSYAALLVSEGYQPPSVVPKLPEVGGAVLGVKVAEAAQLQVPRAKLIRFAGYEWELRSSASDRGGTRNYFHPDNVWTDGQGAVHLRIAKRDGRWSSAELHLTRSLGYGSYRVRVRNTSHLEPAAVFSIFTWDGNGPTREMDVEISQWGEPASKNAQYVVQPYYVPANAVRFFAPAGPLTHSFHWEAGRVRFETTAGAKRIDQHSFSSGVPAPGNEQVHINLYVFDNPAHPLQRETEVVVEQFEYLP